MGQCVMVERNRQWKQKLWPHWVVMADPSTSRHIGHSKDGLLATTAFLLCLGIRSGNAENETTLPFDERGCVCCLLVARAGLRCTGGLVEGCVLLVVTFDLADDDVYILL